MKKVKHKNFYFNKAIITKINLPTLSKINGGGDGANGQMRTILGYKCQHD